jgi:hypothetical protein
LLFSALKQFSAFEVLSFPCFFCLSCSFCFSPRPLMFHVKHEGSRKSSGREVKAKKDMVTDTCINPGNRDGGWMLSTILRQPGSHDITLPCGSAQGGACPFRGKWMHGLKTRASRKWSGIIQALRERVHAVPPRQVEPGWTFMSERTDDRIHAHHGERQSVALSPGNCFV